MPVTATIHVRVRHLTGLAFVPRHTIPMFLVRRGRVPTHSEWRTPRGVTIWLVMRGQRVMLRSRCGVACEPLYAHYRSSLWWGWIHGLIRWWNHHGSWWFIEYQQMIHQWQVLCGLEQVALGNEVIVRTLVALTSTVWDMIAFTGRPRRGNLIGVLSATCQK